MSPVGHGGVRTAAPEREGLPQPPPLGVHVQGREVGGAGDQHQYTQRRPDAQWADATGQVKLPNVNTLVETMDMREAQRSYEANLNIVTATRRMISRTLEILRA